MLDISDMTLTELLVHLAGPLGITAWMLYLSNAVRNLMQGNLARMSPSDQEIALWLRRLRPLKVQALVTAVALGVPLLAHLVITFVPLTVLERLEPTFAFISKLLAIYLLQQVWYQITKQPDDTGMPPAAEQVPPITVHAPIQIVPANAPSGPGAIAPGVSVEPLAINNQSLIGDQIATLEAMSDMDLRRLQIKIVEMLQQRGSAALAA